MSDDPIFQPLRFRNLEVKNRVLRSSISGRFDNYEGSGTRTRMNWELRFARGPAAQTLADIAAEVGADLIVVGHHRGRHLQGLRPSVASDLIQLAPCPVVVVG